MPSAPASSSGLASHGRFQGTRASGTQEETAVAVIMACAVSIEMGPCSQSTMRKSKPQPARICTNGGEGRETKVPTTGSPRASLSLSGLTRQRTRPPGSVPGLTEGTLTELARPARWKLHRK